MRNRYSLLATEEFGLVWTRAAEKFKISFIAIIIYRYVVKTKEP